MFEASGGIINFLAILIPTVMGLYYGFRCLFQTDAAIRSEERRVGKECER